jgi:LacI family transcriptional regulator
VFDKGLYPDGSFTVNDLTAVGAMKAIKSKNMKIPEDVAVVGFGDDITLSEMVDPTLSSVMQPGYKMGQKAAELLLDRINGISHEEIQCVELETNLRVRHSSKRR